MAKGVRAAGASAAILPISDGGDGLIESLLYAKRGRLVRAPAAGPLGARRMAEYGMLGKTAVIEMARASGLALLRKDRLDPMSATSRGTGELIAAAMERGAARLWIGLGGSATNDGGAGMAEALGALLLDSKGRPVPPGPAGLLKLARIDATRLHPRLRRTEIRLVSDVTNPLLGPKGSARVYGPQKGATPKQVALIEKALSNWARIIRRDMGRDVARVPGGGAAGGLGAGLLAFTDAKLAPGSRFVLEALSAEAEIRKADLVLTGEGRFDSQSFYGKAPAELAKLASRLGKPVGLVCGQLEKGLEPRLKTIGIGPVVSLTASRKPEEAIRKAPALLARAAKVITAVAYQ
jgi:glycerate kinase